MCELRGLELVKLSVFDCLVFISVLLKSGEELFNNIGDVFNF